MDIDYKNYLPINQVTSQEGFSRCLSLVALSLLVRNEAIFCRGLVVEQNVLAIGAWVQQLLGMHETKAVDGLD